MPNHVNQITTLITGSYHSLWGGQDDDGLQNILQAGMLDVENKGVDEVRKALSIIMTGAKDTYPLLNLLHAITDSKVTGH